MKFTDRLTLDGDIRTTKDGYAVASARVARANNVQAYRGFELGMPDKETIRVFRPADEVFKKDALVTYAGVPVTVGHPSTQVTADNWKEHAVGESGEEVLRDGEFVRVPLMLRDTKAIKALNDGKRELSMGYEASLIMVDGVAPNGEAYDAIMSNFKMNHVALCKTARGGNELRFGDNANALSWGASPVRHKATDEKHERTVNMELRKVLVDGLQVETTEAGATAITKLTTDLMNSAGKFTALEGSHAAAIKTKDEAHVTALGAKDAVIAEKDKALAAKDAEIDALKAKVLTDEQLDKRVAERASLVGMAVAIAKDAGKEVVCAGLTDAAIRKAVVAAVLGDAAIKDKADAYVDARFEILSEETAKKLKANGGGLPTVDNFANVRQDSVVLNNDAADKARLENEAGERDAWRGKAA